MAVADRLRFPFGIFLAFGLSMKIFNQWVSIIGAGGNFRAQRHGVKCVVIGDMACRVITDRVGDGDWRNYRTHLCVKALCFLPVAKPRRSMDDIWPYMYYMRMYVLFDLQLMEAFRGQRSMAT